jgi:UbiD family decarboxylase
VAKDLQEFLTGIEKEFPDGLLHVESEVDPQKYEITALMTLLARKGSEQIVRFENPLNVKGGEGLPFVTNVFANRGLCARAVGLPYDHHGMALVEEFGKKERMNGEIKIMSDAPCQQIIRQGNSADLWELPIPRHHQNDAGPYLTMTCVMKGLNEDFYDITFTKNWAKAPNRMSVSAHAHHHLARIIREHEKKDLPTPMIVVLGHHPAFCLSACCLMPYGNDDYLTASAFLEEPLRLCHSVTWGEQFLVPADAEIIIEAEVPPGIRETQNPFGEIAGYYQPAMQSPVAEIKAITMKKNAVMQGIFPGNAEHWHLGGIPKEGTAFQSVKHKFLGVTAVHLPPSSCGRFSCVISMEKEMDSDPRRAAMMMFPEIEHLKMVTVVDADIDIYNEREVQWAVVTRTHWDKDIEIIRNVQGFRQWMGEAVIIIDATRPSGIDFPEKNEVPPEAIEAVRKKKLI